jgi:hypothetical protein
VCGLSFALPGYLWGSSELDVSRVGEETVMGDIEGTLGSGLASSGGGVAFDPEEIEAGPGVPTGDQKPTNESADVDNVTESGGAREHRVPEKKE